MISEIGSKVSPNVMSELIFWFVEKRAMRILIKKKEII